MPPADSRPKLVPGTVPAMSVANVPVDVCVKLAEVVNVPSESRSMSPLLREGAGAGEVAPVEQAQLARREVRAQVADRVGARGVLELRGGPVEDDLGGVLPHVGVRKRKAAPLRTA